ncbi:MAG: M23 family metallopeptidase [Firmicutes bacterium]|nr:M23 family metallopeptidase [Bacillota bacterium]
MKKNKLYVQIVICLVIGILAIYGSQVKQKHIVKYYGAMKSVVMEETTREDVVQTWSQVKGILSDAPSKVVSVVTAVNESTKYGVPMDEEGSSPMMSVHAVAGGKVLKSGISQELGQYIQIQHESAVSTYGNLESINVVETERVQRGEIIGTYDSFNEAEFYYQLDENL